MKSLYITSVEKYSGKTAMCLALGKYYQQKGLQVGYLKPFSLQPWRIGEKVADEDAAFVIDMLGLDSEPWEISPVVVTPENLREHLRGKKKVDRMGKIKKAAEEIGKDKDVLLLEGGGSLREGYVMDLPTPAVATELESNILAIVRYYEDVSLLDDILTAQFRLGKSLTGVLINRVPERALSFVNELVVPYLEDEGVPVLGVLPEERKIAALTVGEIIHILDAEILTKSAEESILVEALMVGAMTEDAALRRFRKQHNKAVITGGDRTDVQLAAMETSTSCLVLTGNLHPNPLVIKQADQMGVPILLVPENTMETVEALDRVFGKTRLGQISKLKAFMKLVHDHVDLERLNRELEV